MSKMFDPTDEETAMSPKPFRATMTDVIKSGMDVPAAKNVRPMTYGLNIHRSQRGEQVKHDSHLNGWHGVKYSLYQTI